MIFQIWIGFAYPSWSRRDSNPGPSEPETNAEISQNAFIYRPFKDLPFSFCGYFAAITDGNLVHLLIFILFVIFVKQGGMGYSHIVHQHPSNAVNNTLLACSASFGRSFPDPPLSQWGRTMPPASPPMFLIFPCYLLSLKNGCKRTTKK